MIKSVNTREVVLEDLENRLMDELEKKEEYGCWSNRCSGYCPGDYTS